MIFISLWDLREYIYLFSSSLCRYIFREIVDDANCPNWRKILAGITVVGFICTLWREPEVSVIIWCVLNIICLELEIIGKRTTLTHIYCDMRQLIGVNVCDRINGLFGSQLLMVSVITNVYYIGGNDVGKVIANRVFFDVSIWDHLVASVIGYCCYQACEFLTRHEESHEHKEIAIA